MYVLFRVFIVFLPLCDFNLQNKSNYVYFGVEQRLLAYVNQVCIAQIKRVNVIGIVNIF